MKYARIAFGLMLLALMTGCGTKKPEPPPYAGIKIGKPYEVFGRWYNPQYDAHYDEIGMASWYGPGFHGGHTANGERYDQDALTAAHRTLPLPSIVRVTNLDNGRSILVKVNDRGPFARNRIIDLSRACAKKLDIIRNGSAKVRVQFLEQETQEYVHNMQEGTKYAMTELKQVDPEIAGEREEMRQQPQLHVEGRMFDEAITPVTAIPAAPPPQTRTVFSLVDEAQAGPAPRATTAAYAPVDAPSAQGSFFVKAGTFARQENAHRLTETLSGVAEAQVMEVLVNDKRFYRVMLGPFHAQEDAKNILSKLAALGIPDAAVIRN